ncbi:hypothetical protein [Pseudoclavibacter endophyticus]|uniref:hypothetical protein n=1 Tax=Pseudoclavibacter endophyticus TaxID=1778590 RepID=UPI0016646D44|nr:hypothetical protein [Pseudoclavibacter endophyticus]
MLLLATFVFGARSGPSRAEGPPDPTAPILPYARGGGSRTLVAGRSPAARDHEFRAGDRIYEAAGSSSRLGDTSGLS